MRHRILIVEDEQLVAADLEDKLTRLGYDVVGMAASGPDALRLASEEDPELVLMDVRLQGSMDGIETAKRLKNITLAPVIFVTAFAQVSGPNGGRLLGGLTLSKPFSRDQLHAAVRSVLGR